VEFFLLFPGEDEKYRSYGATTTVENPAFNSNFQQANENNYNYNNNSGYSTNLIR